MRIAIGSDHLGLDLKGALITALEADGHVMLDLGAFSAEPVDYPDYARVVGQAVFRGFVDGGVLVCGSAVAAAIAANKIRGVRAVPSTDAASARESREGQDTNVLCLSSHALGLGQALDVTQAWIGAKFGGDEASVRQIAKLAQLEAGLAPGDKEAARPAASAPSPRPAPARPAEPREPAP